MSYQCIKCDSPAIFDSNMCESCLEHALTVSLLNFGTPDYYICSNCESRIEKLDFWEHVVECNKNRPYPPFNLFK
jgi:hypothetical protein